MRIDEAQLYKLNNQYFKLMNMLRNFEEDIHLFEERANDLATKKELTQEKLNEAQRIDDEDAIEKASKDLDDINSQIDQVKTMVVILSDKMKVNQEKVNKVIEKIKKKPGIRKHVKEELAKNYIKQIKYAEGQKRRAQNKKSLIIQLKQAISKDSILANNLSEILTLENILRNKKRELIKYQKETEEANEGELTVLQRLITGTKRDIEHIQTSIEINKVSLKKGIKSHNIPMTNDDIDLISKQRIISNKDGKADPEKMVKKRIEILNNNIKGYDKQISNNYTALDNLKNDRVQEQEEPKPEKKTNKFKLLLSNLKNFVKRAISMNKVKLLPAASNLTDDDIRRLMQEVKEELADNDEPQQKSKKDIFEKYKVAKVASNELLEEERGNNKDLKYARRQQDDEKEEITR